jgi:hypothetical protein
VHVDHTPEQKALRREIREYYARLITPAVRAQLSPMEAGSFQRRIVP